MRILGVMQRLALSYGAAALIAVTVRHRRIPWIAAGLLAGYFAILLSGHGLKFPNKTSSASSTEQYSARRTCTVRAISPSTRKDC